MKNKPHTFIYILVKLLKTKENEKIWKSSQRKIRLLSKVQQYERWLLRNSRNQKQYNDIFKVVKEDMCNQEFYTQQKFFESTSKLITFSWGKKM